MMQNTAAGRHSVCRDNNRRKSMVIDRFRFLDTPGELHALGRNRIGSISYKLRHFKIMFFDVFSKDTHSVYSHRAIHIHRQDRNAILDLELAQNVKQLLSAADSERRNQQSATS